MSGNAHSLSRRRIIQATAGAGIVAAAGSLAWIGMRHRETGPTLDLARLLPQVKFVRDALLAKAQTLLDVKNLARSDGYVYTIDAAQLMIVFAEAGDAAGYDAMRKHASSNLIIDDPLVQMTRGFVPWRWKANEKPDASGTTEALRLARGLWLGAKAFNRPGDADLAMTILAGYARHAMVDQGVWIICNYFNFSSGNFASNSYLVDYDADFVREVAEARGDASLAKVAEQSYAVVRRAVAPSGLLYDIIQPEVATLYPELNLTAFSPNDVIQYSNCCTTASTVTRGEAEIPRKILALALNRLDDLRRYYIGRTGEPLNTQAATVSEYSILTRMAISLNAQSAVAAIADRAMNDWRWCASHLEAKQVFTLTEILQTMHALMAMGK